MHVSALRVDFYLLKLYTGVSTSMNSLVHHQHALLRFHLNVDAPRMLALQKAQQLLLAEVTME